MTKGRSTAEENVYYIGRSLEYEYNAVLVGLTEVEHDLWGNRCSTGTCDGRNTIFKLNGEKKHRMHSRLWEETVRSCTNQMVCVTHGQHTRARATLSLLPIQAVGVGLHGLVGSSPALRARLSLTALREELLPGLQLLLHRATVCPA